MAAKQGPIRATIRRWFLWTAATLSAGVGVLLLFAVFRIVPPITGHVTDALTGDAVAGVNVTFDVERYAGFGAQTDIHDVSLTNPSGWFWLRAFFHWRGQPIPYFGSYWLTVNQALEETGGSAASAEAQVLYNPMSNRTGGHEANTKYFPVAVTFEQNGCDRVWPATCLYRSFWWGVSIPLIPVLDDVQRCGTIGDASLRERCRQLNTYRAAFLHVDTFDDAQQGRRLCAVVDGNRISAACLMQLSLYASAPNAYNRAAPTPDAEPRFAGLFLDAIGDAVRTRQECDPEGNYSGHLQCRAVYEDHSMVRLVTVTFEEWAGRGSPPGDRIRDKPVYSDYYRATVKREARTNGIIRMYRGPENVVADWASKNRYLRLAFHRRNAAEDSFIEHYLSKFPSTEP